VLGVDCRAGLIFCCRKQSSALARPMPTRWSTSKDDEFTHGIKSGPGYVTGLVFQWQNEKQITVWPEKIAEGKLKFPDFVKMSQ
jgi:hypothetical protein